jgi:hypothetical protein
VLVVLQTAPEPPKELCGLDNAKRLNPDEEKNGAVYDQHPTKRRTVRFLTSAVRKQERCVLQPAPYEKQIIL